MDGHANAGRVEDTVLCSETLKSLFTVNSPCPGGSTHRSSCSPTGCCIYTHTHTQRKTKWLKSIESTLSKATLMKLNVAPIYCFPKHMKWEVGSCMDASLERVKQELWGRVLRWRRVVCVGVQLCIHERNSCGRFSQLDKAKAAAGAVCSRQHEWKPEINKL